MPTQISRVRIVPLFRRKKKVPASTQKEGTELFEEQAPAPPANAQLSYNGGALIQNVTVCTIFWGSAWSSDPTMKGLIHQINQFFKDILVSSLIDQLGEYNVTGQYSIGHGNLLGTTVITAGAPGPAGTIDDGAIRSELKNWIAGGQAPATTTNTLYFVYQENQVGVTMEGSSSCNDFCGYHDAIDNTIYYAVMPYPACDGCLGGLPVIDAISGTSSHELCEAITDPVPPSGWYNSPNNMVMGDLCAWTFKTVAGHNVQNEWSNAANSCT